MWVTCPNCTNNTGWKQENGSIRCIPCGYGIMPRLKLLSPEEARKAADFLSGGKHPQ